MSEGTEFSRVIIGLENICLPYEKLIDTPSARDGIDLETETELRNLGCELIQTAGILLKLPQVAMATGQVLFQRFFYSKSFVKHNYEHIAMACVNLAAKIEEEPRRLRDVLSVFHHIKQMRDRVKMTVSPLILDQRYVDLKNQAIKAERRVLKELGFCVHVKHPHKIIVMYLQVLNCHRNLKFVQTAWNFMNDCLRTHAFVRFDPETIACACIYLAARQIKIPLPNDPHWFSALRVPEEDIREVCLALLKNYARPRPSVEKIEKVLRQAKEKLQAAKLQARLAGAAQVEGTPTGSGMGSPRVESPTTLKTRRREDKSPEAPRPVHEGRADSSPSPVPNDRRRSAPSSPAEKNGRRKRTPPRGYRDDSLSPVPDKRSRAERQYHKHDKYDHREERHHKRRRSASYSPPRALSPLYSKKERRRSPRVERRRKKDKVSNGRHRAVSPDRRPYRY